MGKLQRLRSAFRGLSPYFPIAGAAIALGSWWLSTVTADSARRLEQRVSAALDRFEADRRATDLERQLANAEKQATRIELRSGPSEGIANSLARIEGHLGISRPHPTWTESQDAILRDFVASGDGHYWTQVAWGDLSLVYRERDRMLRDLGDIPYPACTANLLRPADERLQRIAKCIEGAGNSGFETSSIVARLQSVRLPETSSGCIRDRAKHVHAEVGEIYDAFRDARSAMRTAQQATGTLSVSITNPDFRQMEVATTQYGQINEVARRCIAPELLAVSNEVSLVRQRLIGYAEDILLPQRRSVASWVGAIAIMLFVLSAVIGIYGKWEETRRKNLDGMNT